MDCLFCRIASKEIPAQVVYEDKDTMAFLDINPRAPGHTVVIPKKHRATLAKLEKSEIAPLFLAVQKIAIALEKAFSADGLTVGINQGAASGQIVEHLHIHLLPRFKSDGGKSIHSVVNNPPRESLEEIKNKIRKSL